jgi:diacylglycerol kinase family enzyme
MHLLSYYSILPKLDVIVLRRGDLGSFLSMAAHVVARNDASEPIQHWQAQGISLVVDLPQTVQIGGEILGKAPLHVKVMPQAAHIIVPGSMSWKERP